MKKTQATVSYSLVQAACWGFFAILMNFSSNFLYSHGFSSGQISLLLGIVTALACGLQLAVAELTSRFSRLRLYGILLGAGAVMLACAVGMTLFASNIVAAVSSFSVACMVLQTFPALCNSLAMDAIEKGSATNYSVARCIGSLGYSTIAYLTGILVNRKGAGMLPVLAGTVSVLFVISIFWYHLTGEQNLQYPDNKRKVQEKKESFLRENPKFAVFLLGSILLCLGHNLMSNFLLQIMMEKGGNSQHQGTAAAVSAIVELPVMLFFPILMSKVHCGKWVALSSLFMVVKAVGVFFCITPGGVIAIQATQMIGYGLFYISSVNYAVLAVGRGDAIRAQSYLATTVTIGTLIALSTGGVLCQYAGVQTMVLVSIAVSVLGAAVVLVSTEKKEK